MKVKKVFKKEKFTVCIDLVFKMPKTVVINQVVYIVDECEYCNRLFPVKDLSKLKISCIIPYYEYICMDCINEVPCKEKLEK